jgi:hypothetical protein
VKIPVQMSVAEFLTWDPQDGQLIANHLATRGSSCSVVTASGIAPHVSAGFNFRIPDLTVTCSDYPTEKQTLTEPVLVVKILSPATRPKPGRMSGPMRRSRACKRSLCCMHTASIAAAPLRRRPDGTWVQEPESITGEGRLLLESVGFEAALAALYRTTRLAGRR